MNALSELVTLSLKKNVSEAVIQRCSVEKVFLEILQSSQERLWHRRFSCEFCEISKNIFYNRTPQGTASHSFQIRLFN